MGEHNKFYDMVYIINLKKNKINKQKSHFQLKTHNFKNYKFIDAINGKNKYYLQLYDTITSSMTESQILYHFQKGALGCFLSHILCIQDAKKNGFKQILVLEDDFIIIDNYNEEIINLFNNINVNWDFIYLGKKQSNIINEKYVYKPDYETFGTHSILIKYTIFESIIELSHKITNAIDVCLQKLYDKYNFYAVCKDLFISDDTTSDIQIAEKPTSAWNWDLTLYKKINHLFIKNCIIYGSKKLYDIYYSYIKYYYPTLNVYFFDENDIQKIKDKNICDNSIIICAPVHQKYIYGENVFYIFIIEKNYENNYKKQITYNDETKNLMTNIFCYIILFYDEHNSYLVYYQQNILITKFKLENGSCIKEKSVISVKNNLEYHYENNITQNRYFACFESITDSNMNAINDLVEIFIKKNIFLLINYSTSKQKEISDIQKNLFKQTNCIKYELLNFDENNKYVYIYSKDNIKCILILQNHINISNIIFKILSKGYIIITNNLSVKNYFTTSIYNEELSILIDNIIHILNNKNTYCEILNEQIKEFTKQNKAQNNINLCFNYLNSIETNKKNLLIFEKNYVNTTYILWFRSSNTYKNKYIFSIKNEDDIIDKLENKENVLINSYNYKCLDVSLVVQLIKNYNYDIFIDDNFYDMSTITNICNLNNVSYKIKNRLKINCLIDNKEYDFSKISPIVDILQKTSKNILVLNNIFNFNNNVLNKYDTLYGLNIEKFTGNFKCQKVINYFKQFEDFATLQDKTILLFNLNNTLLENVIDFIEIIKPKMICLSYSNILHNLKYNENFKHNQIYYTDLETNILNKVVTPLDMPEKINELFNLVNNTNIEYVNNSDYEILYLHH